MGVGVVGDYLASPRIVFFLRSLDKKGYFPLHLFEKGETVRHGFTGKLALQEKPFVFPAGIVAVVYLYQRGGHAFSRFEQEVHFTQ